ncbi:MAG: NAD-dependent epimerase/dehydratase family protein, partial [Bacteroidota bacterium]
MRTILVTGATGFIGNYVIEELLKNNYPVVASSASGEKARSFPWYSRVQYIQFDLASFNDKTDYYALFNQPEVMIHLAWEGLPAYKEPFHYEVNLPRHFALLRNMILHGLKRLSVTGTCFEYGMQEGELSEDMPSNPSNSYAIAKDALRKQLLELRQVIPIDLTWIRLFYLYGRGQNPNSLLSQLQKALDEKASVFNMSGGEQVRDYLPVEKAAEYIVKIALQQNLTGIINCCSGQPVTVKGLVMDYLKRQKTSVPLNLGFYPYADYEP